jgi:hypothetical protein
MVRGVAVIPSADIGRLRSPVVSVSLRERFRAGEAADRVAPAAAAPELSLPGTPVRIQLEPDTPLPGARARR